MNRKILGMLMAVAVLAGTGGYLYTAGKLPSLASATVAAADSMGTDGRPEGAGGQDTDGEETTVAKAIPVELSLVEGRGIAAYYRAASVIEADRLVELVARTQGLVHALNVEEGDWVEEGQILAELDNGRERIQLRKANLTLGDKERQRDRSRLMLEEELISQQEFDDMESAFKLAQAERDLARIALEETHIRAPFAGRITERHIVPGQQLAALTPAMTIGDFTPLRVRVHLPEAVARKVSSGQRVMVAPESMDRDLEAVVERVSPVVDPATSTVRLTLLLEDSVGLARVGGFVKVRITTDEHHDALAIPKLALVEEGSLRSVFVAEGDTVRKVEIETGLYDESHVEILQGVFEGDYVVTMGQGGLRTGSHIEVLNAAVVDYRPTEDSPPTTALAQTE